MQQPVFKLKPIAAAIRDMYAPPITSTSLRLYDPPPLREKTLDDAELISFCTISKNSKAVLARFNQHNTAEVLDFNLHLSSEDAWMTMATPNRTMTDLATRQILNQLGFNALI